MVSETAPRSEAEAHRPASPCDEGGTANTKGGSDYSGHCVKIHQIDPHHRPAQYMLLNNVHVQEGGMQA